MHRLFTISFVAFFASVSATDFQDCGSLGGGVTFDVEGCTSPPCILKRGNTYHIRFQFDASTNSDTLTTYAAANIGGFEIPWPGLDPDACKQLSATTNPCPIESGSHVDWAMDAEVLSQYPALETTVTFQLQDASGGTQTCAKVPAKII